jgi:tetratricopeptide (TPR) repeat protein
VGGAVPAVGLVIAIVTIGARLTGAAYERWMARVMSAPYTPALFDPAVIDANTALVLLGRSPKLSQVFKDELDRGDRRFLLTLTKQALSENPSDALWQGYPGRFANLGEVDAAVAEFQSAAIELEVSKDIDPTWAAAAGGLGNVMSALGRIDGNDAARADLDMAVMAMDKLRQADQPVEKLFDEARTAVVPRP